MSSGYSTRTLARSVDMAVSHVEEGQLPNVADGGRVLPKIVQVCLRPGADGPDADERCDYASNRRDQPDGLGAV